MTWGQPDRSGQTRIPRIDSKDPLARAPAVTDITRSPQDPARIDLDEVARLVDALEADLARARTDSSQIDAMRAEVEQLRAMLAAERPESAEDEGSVRERLNRLGDVLVSDAFEGSQYITRIGRLLGM